MTEKQRNNNRERQRRYQEKKRAEKQAAMEQKKLELLNKPENELTLQQAVNQDDISGRTRTWLFIVYPESAPENWRSILDGFHVPWVESPLHDADINADNTEKKAHWHVMLLFDSVKSYQQITPFSKAVNGSFPIKCRSMRGSIRYFYHADNPEKAQYNKKDIKGHCGADVEKLLELSESEKAFLLNQVFEFIVENEIVEYADILDYARLWRSEWYDLIVHSYTLVIKSYLQSRRNSGHVRFYLSDDGNMVDGLQLTYDERIKNLQDEIKRLQEEKDETIRKQKSAEKLSKKESDNNDTKRA